MERMQITVVLFFLFPALQSQEIIIPVGEKGNDTLTVIRSQDGEGNYDVGYNENQLTGGASFHRERGFANGTRTGSYGYTTRSGLIRIVTYIADNDGYRAEILTNEPGMASENPSNVTVTKEEEPVLGQQNPTDSSNSQGPISGNPPSSVLYASSSNPVRNYVMYKSETNRNFGKQNFAPNGINPAGYYGARLS